MRLSKRRFEFLEALVDLVSPKGTPVHYVDVSERMSVSKWTAYDMMRELVEDGLAERSYSVNRAGLPGRSQVLFRPTEKGFNLVESYRFKKQPPQPSIEYEWQHVRNDLLKKITMASNKETARPLDLSKTKYNSSPVAYCAAFLTFLIIEAKRKGLDLVALRGILEIGSDNGMTLPLFTGLLIGGLLVREARKMLPDIENLIHSFSRQVEHLEQSNKDMLLEFAQTIVSNGMLAQGDDTVSVS